MKVKNISKRSYIHSKLDDNFKLVLLTLRPNEVMDIPDEVAKTWVKSGEVVEYVSPVEAQKLADENKELKEKLEALEKTGDKKETKAKSKKSSKKASKK